jgi:hypothetical protein
MANNYLSSTYSDEWYTDQDTVDKAIRYLQIKPKSRVICPFDTDKSLFVQTLQKQGHFTMFGMTDFLHSSNYEFDYLITNPPFSFKDAVMEKVYQYGKPGLLMLPLDILGGVKRAALYATYGAPKVIVPTRRISYFDSNYVKRKASNFHSVYALFNTGQTGIEWENVTT